jgi:ABC-2 type transport system ATP-binding protein
MDEAERCHRLVYISYGKMLAAGTAPEVIAQAGLRTWAVHGPRLDAVLELVEQQGWMAVPFGTSLHVSSSDHDDFPRWLAERDATLAQSLRIERIATGLEDVFIALTQDARDTVT